MVKKFTKGRWSLAEHIRYTNAYNTCNTWKEISSKVKTRTPQQCLSHHQKMEVKHKKEKAKTKDEGTQYEIQNIQLERQQNSSENNGAFNPRHMTENPWRTSATTRENVLGEILRLIFLYINT